MRVIGTPPYVVDDPRCKLYIRSWGTAGNTKFFDASPLKRAITATDLVNSETYKKFDPCSLRFNGTTSNISIADSDDWAFGSAWGAGAWVNVLSLGGLYTPIFAQYVTGSLEYQFGFDASGHLMFYMYDSGYTTNVISTGTVSPGSFVHAGVIQSAAGTTKLYLNGVETGYSSTTSATVPNLAAALTIGKRNTIFSNIYLDELVILKGKVSAIRELYSPYRRFIA